MYLCRVFKNLNNMANTYSQIYHHYIFAVQHRECLILPEWKDELYKYMTGCISNHKCKLLSIGGVADHIHILTGMDPSVSCATLMADVKRSSTIWINEKFYRPGVFSWQEGYGVFSYARSAIPNVAAYIENQAQHHKQQTFQEEYLKTLQDFGVEYDEQYIFHPVL